MEGLVLKNFIERQNITKSKIAEDLGMNRSNLYQYFDNQTLGEEIKKRFEEYFRRRIFTEEAIKEAKQSRIVQLNKNQKIKPMQQDYSNDVLYQLSRRIEDFTERVAELKDRIEAERKMNALLEETNKALREHNKKLQDLVIPNLDNALKNLVTHHAVTEAYQEEILRVVSKIDGADYKTNLDKVYISEIEKQLAYGNTGIVLPPDNQNKK